MHKAMVFAAGILLASTVSSCLMLPSYLFDGNNFYYIPGDLKDEKTRKAVVKKFAPCLAGRRIFLDPGHGGSDRKNVSSRRDVIEADVNLRVALLLKEYLEEAGAVVYASRLKDETVDLKKRSDLLNGSDAEIYIGIHHDAPRVAGNYWINYTATYYHSQKGDYRYDPFSNDMARFIQRDLAYAMRNSGGLGSFDGTYSDYMIYPGEGFAVLRLAGVPAVLVECSFFTNPVEEIRLSDEQFNRVQAWAIFKGLGKFYRAGYPEIALEETKRNGKNKSLELRLKVVTKNKLDKKSVSVMWNRKELQSGVDAGAGTITVTIPKVDKGTHEIKVTASDVEGRFNYPFAKKMEVGE